MTENQSIAFDKAADALAAGAVCSTGPADCAGRTKPVPTDGEPAPEAVFRRASFAHYRQAAGMRIYLCRFCRTAHKFPGCTDAERQAEPANHDPDARVDQGGS